MISLPNTRKVRPPHTFDSNTLRCTWWYRANIGIGRTLKQRSVWARASANFRSCMSFSSRLPFSSRFSRLSRDKNRSRTHPFLHTLTHCSLAFMFVLMSRSTERTAHSIVCFQHMPAFHAQREKRRKEQNERKSSARQLSSSGGCFLCARD